MYTARCTVYSVQERRVYTEQYIVHKEQKLRVYTAQCSVQCTVYSEQECRGEFNLEARETEGDRQTGARKHYSVQCTVYSVQCTV